MPNYDYSFPTDAYEKARQYQVESQDRDNPALQIGNALGKGAESGISYGIQNQDVIKKQRSIMLQEWLKNNMLVDSSEKPLDLNRIMQINQDFVQKGQIDGVGEDVFIKPLKQAGNVYIQGSTGGITPAISDLGQPLKSTDKLVKTAPAQTDLTNDEWRELAEADIQGLGSPNFGLGNNPLRSKYQKIKADLLEEMGGASNASQQRTQVLASRAAQVGAAKVQEAKVNMGTNLLRVLEAGYNSQTDTYTIPPSAHVELALGYSRMLSPQGVVPYELMKEIKQGTAEEALHKTAIYWGLDPAIIGGTTQSVANYFAHMIARQGSTAEQLRNQYTGGRGTSFNKMLNQSPLKNKLSIPLQSQGSQPQGGNVSASVQGNPQIPQTQPQMKPMTATNRQTGQKIISYDGGKSWQIAQ